MRNQKAVRARPMKELLANFVVGEQNILVTFFKRWFPMKKAVICFMAVALSFGAEKSVGSLIKVGSMPRLQFEEGGALVGTRRFCVTGDLVRHEYDLTIRAKSSIGSSLNLFELWHESVTEAGGSWQDQPANKHLPYKVFWNPLYSGPLSVYPGNKMVRQIGLEPDTDEHSSCYPPYPSASLTVHISETDLQSAVPGTYLGSLIIEADTPGDPWTYTSNVNVEATIPVPEPSTVLLLGIGILYVAVYRRRSLA